VGKGGTLAGGRKKKEKPDHVMGRPKAKIDWDEVKRLSQLQCTQMEIAAVLDINVKTLTQHPEFSDNYTKGKELGKMSLRRKQLHWADRNPGMAIFLGKVYLHQREQDVLDIQNVDQHLKDIAAAIRERDG